MKRTLLLLCSLLLYGLSYAQSAQPQVIGSDGDILIFNAGFQMEYTVGEVVTETLDGGTFKLSQGFHQPNLIVVSVDDFLPELAIEVFPNPTVDQVNIRLTEDLGQLQYQLFDLKGQALGQVHNFVGLSQSLDLSGFPAGTYFLHIQGTDNPKHKSFKISKIK